MAYVSISKSLLEDVKTTIDRLGAAELATLPKIDALHAKADRSDELRSKVDELMWGELVDLKPRLSKYDISTRIDLQVHYKYLEIDKRVEVQLQNGKVPCFRKPGSYGYHDVTVDANLHPILNEIAQVMVERHEVEERWKTVQRQIHTFLEKCKSLNEAVKLWPDIRRYIPKEYLDRVDAKVERSATAKSDAAEALKNIDMDALQTSVVLARMAGAKL